MLYEVVYIAFVSGDLIEVLWYIHKSLCHISINGLNSATLGLFTDSKIKVIVNVVEW